MTHGIIFEPDPQCRATLEAALASLHWTSAIVESVAEIATRLPGPWAVMLAVESGDLATCDVIRALRETAPGTVICVLVDELSPQFDHQLEDAGADAVFAKPVGQAELIEALVAGFMARRG